jgi:recombinational DNA repair ATPase RecF
MLSELRVCNLGVIEELSLVLAPGMTAVTGETGAGKTLVVTAIELLVGGMKLLSRVVSISVIGNALSAESCRQRADRGHTSMEAWRRSLNFPRSARVWSIFMANTIINRS